MPVNFGEDRLRSFGVARGRILGLTCFVAFNIATCLSLPCPEKITRDNVIAWFLLLYVVILPQPSTLSVIIIITMSLLLRLLHDERTCITILHS